MRTTRDISSNERFTSTFGNISRAVVHVMCHIWWLSVHLVSLGGGELRNVRTVRETVCWIALSFAPLILFTGEQRETVLDHLVEQIMFEANKRSLVCQHSCRRNSKLARVKVIGVDSYRCQEYIVQTRHTYV